MFITFIGTGRLAWNLVPALLHAGHTVEVIGRNADARLRIASAYGIATHSDYQSISPQTALVLTAVSDGAIADTALEIAPFVPRTAIVAHCSGSIDICTLSVFGELAGVFYPMQIFTLDSVADFRQASFFLEGAPEILAILQPLAAQLSDRITIADSAERQQMHLGAVFVCNFTNHLYRIADELSPRADIRHYEGLIRAHIERVFALGPQLTQTGPAVRGDIETLKQHLHLLEGTPAQGVYRMLSSRINPALEL